MSIVLQASCVQPASPESAVNYIMTPSTRQPTPTEVGLDMDPDMWEWFSIPFGELSPAEATILAIFALLDYNHISSDFVNGVCAAVARDRQSRHNSIRSRLFRESASKLLSLLLLQRDSIPWL
jgi:hypothetical protein